MGAVRPLTAAAMSAAVRILARSVICMDLRAPDESGQAAVIADHTPPSRGVSTCRPRRDPGLGGGGGRARQGTMTSFDLRGRLSCRADPTRVT